MGARFGNSRSGSDLERPPVDGRAVDASTIFPVGLALWSLMAFAGSAKYWRDRDGPLHAPLARLKSRSAPAFLLLPAVPLALALWSIGLQMAAVERMDGVLGLHWMVAAPLGMVGAALLGAFVFLPVESSPESSASQGAPRSAAARPQDPRPSRRHPLG